MARAKRVRFGPKTGEGRHEHLVQNNLEMYRILKGTQYTSPVQKINYEEDMRVTLVWFGILFCKRNNESVVSGYLMQYIPTHKTCQGGEWFWF